MSRLLEKYKVDLIHMDSTGDTVGFNICEYYDMKGYSRAEFLIAGEQIPVTATGLNRALTCAIYVATDCSGGGAQALSSATSWSGWSSLSSAQSGTNYVNEIIIRWNTFNGWDKAGGTANSANFKLGVGATATALFVDSSAASAAMNYACAGATANGSCAAAGFIAAFNSSSINTSTALQVNFKAEELNPNATLAGVCDVRISRKDPESTYTITFTQDGTNTHVKFGNRWFQHIAVPVEMMGDHRFITCAVKSTVEPCAYSVTLLRERDGDEVRKEDQATVGYTNSLNRTVDLGLTRPNWSKPA